MTTATWVTMIVIMTFVWGGFLFLLRTAVKKESSKEYRSALCAAGRSDTFPSDEPDPLRPR